MQVSQKCQYAVRAVFELAKHHGEHPVKIGDVAKSQAIPPRFLEVILSQLKQAGFVESRRGAEGGYLLAGAPCDLRVGQIIRFIEGPLGPVSCVDDGSPDCPLHGSCVFMSMWRKVQKAMGDVYDNTTFQDLLDEELRMRQNQQFVPSYMI